jgi:hypothetical protein
MRGYSIIHALISLIIFAGITVGGLQWQRFNASVDKGRNIGQQYLTLNAAVNNYMVTYYQALSVLSPQCSEMTFTTVDPATPSWAQSDPTKCALTIATGKVVANGLQPSPAELIMLGLLPASPSNPPNPPDLSGLLQIESPHLPISKKVYEYSTTATPPQSAYSQPRLFINIDMVCVQRGTATNPNTGTAVPTAPGVSGCDSATTTTALKSMIFNTQPYNNNQKNYLFTFSALLGSVFSTIGDDAVSSGMVDVKLVNTNNMLNGKNFQLTHPIKGGPSGILGLRGGYGASYAMQHSRVDGSNPPTADWSFGGHGITSGLSKLKLPVQVLGTACDIKEDIALDATANLLVCRNSIWSTFSTANAGTIDIREYLRLYVQLYPGYSSTNELLNLNYYKNYDQFVSQTTLPNSNITRHNIPYFFNPSTIVCAQITTNVETSKWYPELIEHEEPNVFYKFSVNQEDISPFYQLTVCAPAPDRLYFRSFRFNKINK